MEQGVLEYERVREKKKQLLIKIQETKVGIRHKQNQLQLLEEGLKRIQEQEGSESIGGNLNIFLRDFSVILEALKSDDAFMETKYATQSAQVYYRVEKNVFEDYVKRLSELEIQEFIDYCKQLGFIRVEGNKCLFSSGKARAYFLSKKRTIRFPFLRIRLVSMITGFPLYKCSIICVCAATSSKFPMYWQDTPSFLRITEIP